MYIPSITVQASIIIMYFAFDFRYSYLYPGALKDWKIVLCFDFWSNSFSYFIYEKYLSYRDRIWTVLFLTCMFSGAANESTRDRVIFYTVLEYILLILASGLQAVYIRSLFSKSIGYNRIWWQILQRCIVFFRLRRPGT